MMMIKFKIFEDYYSNFDALMNNFWYIEGDMKYIEQVLYKFMEMYGLDEDIHFYWLDWYMRSSGPGCDYENAMGIYFGFEENDKHAHQYIVMNYDDLIKGKKSWNNDCIYRGKLKIKNEKLYLDTLDIAADKYNL